MSQILFIFIMFASATIQICSSTNWAGTFEESKKCNQTGCCCVKSPVSIRNAGQNNFTTDLNFHGNGCPKTTETYNFTDQPATTVFSIGNGNGTLNGDQLIFRIESNAGSQNPACDGTFQRKTSNQNNNNNNNNNSNGPNSFTVKINTDDMLWFVQIPSFIIMIMVVGFN